MLKFSKRPALLAAALACLIAAPAFADITLSPTGMVQPLVGGSSNTWGATINANFSTINSWFGTGPALSLTFGGTGGVDAPTARSSLIVPGLATTNTFPLAQTFTVAPVFGDANATRGALGATTAGAAIFTAADASAQRTAIGLPIGTSGATVPLLNAANTWGQQQTIASIVAGDAGVLTASAAKLTVENTLQTYTVQLRNAVNAANYVLRTDHGRTDGCALLITFQLTTTVGSICQNGTSTTYNTTSDARLKTDVVPISDALSRLELLRPVRFHWKSNLTGPKVDGFLAHEVTPAVPEAVHGEKDAVNPDGSILPQQLDYSKIVPLLVASVQELDGKVRTLEAKVARLQAANDNTHHAARRHAN